MNRRRVQFLRLLDRLDAHAADLVAAYGHFDSWSEDDLGEEGRQLQRYAYAIRLQFEARGEGDVERAVGELARRMLRENGCGPYASIAQHLANVCGMDSALPREGAATTESAAMSARVSAIRWLGADSAMSVLSDEALRYIAEKVDEHHDALDYFGNLGGEHETVRPPLQIERSLYDARMRCGYVSWCIHNNAETRNVHRRRLWLAALERARVHLLRRCRDAWGSERCAALVTHAYAALASDTGAAQRAEQALLERLPALASKRIAVQTVAIGGELLVYELLYRELSDDSFPSPWSPLLALWERGVATMATLAGELLVYVPVYQGGELVGDPVQGGEVHSEDVLGLQSVRARKIDATAWRRDNAYCDAGMIVRGADWTTPATAAHVSALSQFARHGLVALPGMMLHQADTLPLEDETDPPWQPLALYSSHMPRVALTAKKFDRVSERRDEDAAVLREAAGDW